MASLLLTSESLISEPSDDVVEVKTVELDVSGDGFESHSHNENRDHYQVDEERNASELEETSEDFYNVTETSSKFVERIVNVWLADEGLAPCVGRTIRIGVDIGTPRFGRLETGGGVFSEPDWGDADYLDLSIVLYGEGVTVRPAAQTGRLPRRGAMDAVFFEIEFHTIGTVELSLAVFIAGEETLLQRCEFALEVVETRESSTVQP